MESMKLSTIVRHVDPKLQSMLTIHELNMPVVLRDGINSVTTQDILEIIEATILRSKNGVLLH